MTIVILQEKAFFVGYPKVNSSNTPKIDGGPSDMP
jgi:hypothetical protein